MGVSATQSALDFLCFLPLMPVGLLILFLIATHYNPKGAEYFPWRIYGQRMKRAYTAKFGEMNEEFFKEVDNLVLAMRSLGSGNTKSLTEQKLKSYASFVEIPWMEI